MPNSLITQLLFAFCVVLLPFEITTAQNHRDTLVAEVIYGKELLLEGIDTLSIRLLRRKQDSLRALPKPQHNLLSQLELYIQVRSQSFNSIYSVIDSLFELDEVPYPLINQLNKYLANSQNNQNTYKSEQIDTTIYPAEYFYPEWNTARPTSYSEAANSTSDSIFNLTLVGTVKSPHFVMPVSNKLTSLFGWRNGRMHKGIDIDVNVWDTIVSAFSGMVRVALSYGGYGRVVVIRHFNGLETLYAHLHRIKVKSGQIVQAGELIGLGGSSGNSTGSHLHWEIRFKGFPIDPLSFIDYENQTLISNSLIVRKVNRQYIAYPEGIVFYTVKNGDYLYKIAAQYGISVPKLRKLNGIKRNSYIYVGQKLRVI